MDRCTVDCSSCPRWWRRSPAPPTRRPGRRGWAARPAMTGPGALGGALSAGSAGDCLMLADGSYGGLTISAKGDADAPIVLRAVNRGKVTFTGAINFMGSSYVGI